MDCRPDSPLDIFITYRYGRIDRLHAGRIRDYLQTLGYRVYFDRDEKVNKTGDLFREQIAAALKQCRVIIAVISDSWIARCTELNSPEDLVRTELSAADPGLGRAFLPIYMEKTPNDMPATLPQELQFIRDIQSNFVWTEFEARQRQQLRDRLQELLPRPTTAQKATDWDSLELLCDRTKALQGFDDALHYRPQGSPGAWLLIGERDQGHNKIFQRVRQEFQLQDSRYSSDYRYPMFVDLRLQEFTLSGSEEVNRHIMGCLRAAVKAKAVDSFAQWYQLLPRNTSLALLYSVVHVDTPATAQRWIDRFERIRQQLPTIAQERPPLVWALSLSYDDRCGFVSRLLRIRRMTSFFKALYPALFKPVDEMTLANSNRDGHKTALSRLESGTQTHVTDWYDNIHVRDRIRAIPKDEFTAQFAARAELPMDEVTENLKNVLIRHSGIADAGVSRQ